ncbi:MAG: glycosyltransferase [Bacteroidales bacterium]|nr:glycosyltransferase [Bacteroidales bacterium]
MNNRKITVCHITSVHRAFDDRIFYKECLSLSEIGYRLVLLANNERNELTKEIEIVGIKELRNRLLRVTIRPVFFLIKSLMIWADLYHLHDPELLPIGLILKILGKKVIYDIHELVYYSIDDKSYLKNKFLKSIIKFFYMRLEKISILLFDSVVLAEDGYYDYYHKVYEKIWRKFCFIRNYPVTEIIRQVNYVKKPTVDSITVIYAGLLARSRVIHTIIESLNYCQSQVNLWLLGKWENDSYFMQCSRLSAWRFVTYFGNLKPEEVYAYMKSADIGIALLLPIKNYLTSLPVKSFEYMACGIPVIISDFPYYRRIFYDSVLYTEPQNPKLIAQQIDLLAQNKPLRERLIKKGKADIIRSRTWENEKENLLTLYNNVLGRINNG